MPAQFGIPSTGGDLVTAATQLARQYGDAFSTGDIAAIVNGFNGLPITRVRHTHGYYIRGPWGIVLGGVEGVSETQSRPAEGVFTVGYAKDGRADEDITSTQDGRQLRIRRLDLTRSAMEAAFGVTEWTMLTDMIGRFTLRPTWSLPAGYILSGQPTFEYTGCVITDFGRDLDATGSRVSRAEVTIKFLEKNKLTRLDGLFDDFGSLS